VRKIYQYLIYQGEICSPFLARNVYACRWPLDVAAMEQAAQAILGEHDFTSFAASDPDQAMRAAQAQTGVENAKLQEMVRTMDVSTWSQDAVVGLDVAPFGKARALLCYTVRGNGFLHHMVRNLVGTFLEIGRGRWTPEKMQAILAARDRRQAGPTAPASGLFLVRVEYPEISGPMDAMESLPRRH
jgi:tRNA pseudouridine38-40 synthase